MLDSGTGAPAGLDIRLSTGQARTDIDNLDLGIISLLRMRREVSQRIQQARVQANGPKTDSDREADIARVYRSCFGDSGDEVAAAVLRVCRS
ncbi:chorismate mutase [Streptomyces botrytidirepellens]|uniref:chorismate mutase n=1 Tax=Streptomyces botrytidirepellens TaxID=2486417 RepID=UPI0016144600|nr:chorismate mutase [Streptomyces botrytidirepellens]